MNCAQKKKHCPRQNSLGQALVKQSAIGFPDSECTLHVVHGQISLGSSRVVETLATYRKLDTTTTHLQYFRRVRRGGGGGGVHWVYVHRPTGKKVPLMQKCPKEERKFRPDISAKNNVHVPPKGHALLANNTQHCWAQQC